MLRNILMVAFRSLKRQFSYSIINIVGLAIGISCSLVIFLFVYGEWSYDKGFKNSDRTYRIGISFFNIGKFATGPEQLLNVLPKEFAGIETATRVRKERETLITVGATTYNETNVFFTDTAYFKIFDYNFLSGDERNVLRGPNEAVVTQRVAKRFFGTADVIGKVLEVGKTKTAFAITGVVKNPDFNTHLKGEIWLSVQGQITGSAVWTSASFHNYVLLKKTTTQADLERALELVFDKHVFPESGQPMGFKSLEDYKKNDIAVKFYVHPLQDIYLKSKLNHEISAGGNESNIYIFSAVSFFILLLAAVNFVNLTTARASRRAKEVGIRKTMGSSRGRLITQFLTESVMTSGVAMVLALFLSQFFLLAFEYVTGSSLLDSIWTSPFTLLLFICFSIIVGILSGIYPAFYLTSFTPIKVLKGNLATIRGAGFRNYLVVFQFCISIILITSAAVVQEQLHFISTKDLGFDQQNVLTIDNVSKLKNSAQAYKEELAGQSGVINASFHTGEPGSKRIMSFSTYQAPGMEHPVSINTYFGDADFISLMGMKLLTGRMFDKNLASDTASIILNEAAVKALDLGEEPVGKVINEKQRVIGVVKDFHWESLRNSIAPIAIMIGKDQWELGFKLQPGAVPAFLKAAEGKWKQLAPDETFKYHFVDDNFEEMVKKEEVFGKAINFFTALAIFISCIGLYGLSAYTTEQRTKEIGIRKVLGATSSSILFMLNKKSTLLVLIAILISVPFTIFIMQQWLEDFAYRIQLGMGVFLISVFSSLVIAWLTVSYHSLKASRTNPSDTLKYE
jgi:putative ABC transport system permease protein